MLAIPSAPLLLWILGRLRLPQVGIGKPLVAGGLCSCLTTFTHSDPYLFVFACGWIALVWRDFSWHTTSRTLLFFAALFLPDSPQLLAAVANAPLSHRSNMSAEALHQLRAIDPRYRERTKRNTALGSKTKNNGIATAASAIV